MQLGTDTAPVGQTVEIPLRLSTTAEVEGLVATFHWEGTLGNGVDLPIGSDLLSASPDVVVTRVESDYMVLGVIMDSDGMDSEVIGPGDWLIATAVITGLAPGVSPVAFVDDTYSSVPGGPLLDNVVFVGGPSIGQNEGLVLTNGSFTITEAIPAPGAILLGGLGTVFVAGLRRRRTL